MNNIHYTPIHPGEVLKDEFEEIGLTQSALAKHIGVLPKTINEICFKPLSDCGSLPGCFCGKYYDGIKSTGLTSTRAIASFGQVT